MKVSEDEFRDVLDVAKVPVVVDFYANWCGPCKALMPKFERVAEKMQPDFSFCKVDIDTAESLCEELGVEIIPTIMVFENSRMLAQHQGGFASEDELVSFIEKATVKK